MAGLALALVVATAGLWAQTTVKTLGGGHADRYGVPYGYVDGDTLEEAMFNGPLGLAIGPDGNLWFADRDNGAIRKLLLVAGQTRTVMTNLNQPVGLVFDPGGNFYVLTAGDGVIKKFDTNLNQLAIITTALVGPSAFAMDSATNFFVAQANGTVVRVKPSDATPALIGFGLNNPGGITVTLDGYLAVSDSGNHVIKTLDPAAAPTTGTILSGLNGTAGLRNGDKTLALFNSPQGIAQAPNGMFLVADRLNHQVRLVQTNGYASTFYGVPVANWVTGISPGIGYNGGTIWPGWADGPVDFTDPLKLYPAAHDPMAVLVTSSGDAYTTEWGYHIIRKITGGNLTGAGGGTGGGTTTNAVIVLAPTITPDTGYFPNGQMIRVGSPNPDVFYTTDGTEPTTNSLRVPMTGNWGKIWWQSTQTDLSKLAVKAFIGTNASETVRGKPAALSTIGVTPSVTTNYFASPGSTIFVPVVVNLIPGAQIRSIFYRVEVQASGTAPAVSDQFRLIPVDTNGFISVVALPNSTMTALGYGDAGGTLGGTRGLLISAVGTNLGGTITSFGVLNMLAIPIPATAPLDATYTLTISNPSATSDGFQNKVAIAPAGAATIVVGTGGSGIGVGGNPSGGVGNVALPPGAVGYLVGDSSPGGWFNAGEFGDGNLDNTDVNNAFYASLGIRVPPSFSDAFDAMDAFPTDTATWGGDGEIRFLDWQVILQRASRLDGNNYIRVREANGVRSVIGPFSLTGSPDAAGTTTTALPGSVWVKQAQIFAGFVPNAQPGALVQVPVHVKLAEGFSLSGMSFHARVTPRGAAPAVSGVTFRPASAALQPSYVSDGDPAVGADSLYRVWAQFPARLQGLTLLGHIEFIVPPTAQAGNVYGVRFIASSGGDTTVRPFQEPQFESLPGAVFVGVPAATPAARVSDEWRKRFFGGVDAPEGADDADPDQDGVVNWKEYVAGTNPTQADSRLRLRPGGLANRQVTLDFLSAPGKTYQLEYTEDLHGGVWTSAGTVTGNGDYQQIQVPANSLKPRFYRVRLAP